MWLEVSLIFFADVWFLSPCSLMRRRAVLADPGKLVMAIASTAIVNEIHCPRLYKGCDIYYNFHCSIIDVGNDLHWQAMVDNGRSYFSLLWLALTVSSVFPTLFRELIVRRSNIFDFFFRFNSQGLNSSIKRGLIIINH